jgi:uncharacterized membrane protein YdbT with pleckstrin-like domain
MGRYIDDILQPGEKVLYSTNAHWIFYWPAIAAWILALVVLILSMTAGAGVPALGLSGLAAAVVIAIAGLYFAIRGWFHRFTTETDVTDRRVVHKTGFINRHTFEIALDKIASVDVDQSIAGRLLNYGSVTIVGVGEGSTKTIDTIASPLAFRSAITAR